MTHDGRTVMTRRRADESRFPFKGSPVKKQQAVTMVECCAAAVKLALVEESGETAGEAADVARFVLVDG